MKPTEQMKAERRKKHREMEKLLEEMKLYNYETLSAEVIQDIIKYTAEKERKVLVLQSVNLVTIPDDEFKQICINLENNPSIEKLDLSRCSIGFLSEERCQLLFKAIQNNKSIIELNVYDTQLKRLTVKPEPQDCSWEQFVNAIVYNKNILCVNFSYNDLDRLAFEDPYRHGVHNIEDALNRRLPKAAKYLNEKRLADRRPRESLDAIPKKEETKPVPEHLRFKLSEKKVDLHSDPDIKANHDGVTVAKLPSPTKPSP